jgi:hypothetical protein
VTQWAGVTFGLYRAGRVLIGDEVHVCGSSIHNRIYPGLSIGGLMSGFSIFIMMMMMMAMKNHNNTYSSSTL